MATDICVRIGRPFPHFKLKAASQFPDRKPSHYVFPIERYGLHGKKGTFGGVVNGVRHRPDTSGGPIQSAWEMAKRRTQRRCPSCAAGKLADGKPEGYECDCCNAELEKLPDGLTQFRFHDLRHTAVSRMRLTGQPLPIVAKVVGWRLSTVVNMAERYGHFEEDALRRAVEAIGTPVPVPAVPYVSTYATPLKRRESSKLLV